MERKSAPLLALLISSAATVAPVFAAQPSLAPPPKPTLRPSGAPTPKPILQPSVAPTTSRTAVPPRGTGQSGPGGNAQPPQSYVLDITIVTGDDDLRSDSRAWLAVPAVDNPLCTLRDRDGETWANGSSHTVTCSVKLRSLDDLKKHSSKLLYNGFSPDLLHSYDNWNVDEVRLQVRNPNGNGDQCIFDVAGTPLVRMTQQQAFPVGFNLQSTKFPC